MQSIHSALPARSRRQSGRGSGRCGRCCPPAGGSNTAAPARRPPALPCGTIHGPPHRPRGSAHPGSAGSSTVRPCTACSRLRYSRRWPRRKSRAAARRRCARPLPAPGCRQAGAGSRPTRSHPPPRRWPCPPHTGGWPPAGWPDIEAAQNRPSPQRQDRAPSPLQCLHSVRWKGRRWPCAAPAPGGHPWHISRTKRRSCPGFRRPPGSVQNPGMSGSECCPRRGQATAPLYKRVRSH